MASQGGVPFSSYWSPNLTSTPLWLLVLTPDPRHHRLNMCHCPNAAFGSYMLRNSRWLKGHWRLDIIEVVTHQIGTVNVCLSTDSAVCQPICFSILIYCQVNMFSAFWLIRLKPLGSQLACVSTYVAVSSHFQDPGWVCWLDLALTWKVLFNSLK